MQQKDSDIPVVYTAVTSPKAAGFVDKEGKNVGNITGTSDLVLADKQLKLIRQMMPKSKECRNLLQHKRSKLQSRNRSL